MRPIYNNFLIKPIINDNPLNLIGLDGTPLVISTRFDPLAHSCQYGEIVETPIHLDSKFNALNSLRVGNKIFFHYLVCQDSRKVEIDEQDYYFCSAELIWSQIVGDKMIPLRDTLLVEAIIDDVTELNGVIISIYGKREIHKLKVHSINEYSKELGIQEDDTLLVIKGAGMPIPDSELLFIKISNILGVIRNGELIAVKGKHLIIEDELSDIAEWKGLMVGEMHRNKFQFGTYIDGEKKEWIGKKAMFIHGLSTRLEIDGIKYASVTNSDLIFIEK